MEILVVLAVVAMLTAAIVATSRVPASARLKRSTTLVAAAIKVAYTRATSTSKNLRLVLDFEQNKLWLEESAIPMLVQSKDRTGTGGAGAITDAEKRAQEEGEQILKGPPVPRATFRPIETMGFGDAESGKGGKSLERGITFRSVQTPHDAEPRTQGRAYVYFFPGGLTERAVIQLRIGKATEDNETVSLMLAPLTGKITTKTGPVELSILPADAEDTGF